MKRTPKRYTEAEVLKKIELSKKQALFQRKKAEQEYAEHSALIMANPCTQVAEARVLREKADKRIARACYIETTRMAKLGRMLSELRTEPLIVLTFADTAVMPNV